MSVLPNANVFINSLELMVGVTVSVGLSGCNGEPFVEV